MIYTTRPNTSSIKEFIPEIPIFSDVESEYLNFEKGCRVLPAPFYEEPTLQFELIKRYEPGEKKTFPNGGFEVYGPGNEIRSFDLDQVILHPFELKKFNFFKKSQSEEAREKIIDPNKPKGKRGRPAKLDENGNPIPKKEYVPTGGRRGRLPLSDEEKAKRELEKANQPVKEKGTGQRGRKPLSEEEKAKRELEKQNQLVKKQRLIEAGIISGKRGRPSTLTAEQKEEKRLAELEKDRLRAEGKLKRGRPSFNRK